MRNISLISLPVVAVLAACAGTGAGHRPMLDGAPGAGYAADLKACQNLAASRRWDNAETREDLAFGAVLGAALGAAEGDAGDVVGGAVAGLIGGALSGGFRTRADRRAIVVKCLENRGHPVVG